MVWTTKRYAVAVQDPQKFMGNNKLESVWFRRITINQGEAIAIYNADGEIHFVEGPKRTLLVWQSFRYLKRWTACRNEYMIIKYQDGRREHLLGPCTRFFLPHEHLSISIESAMPIDLGYAVVVYEDSNNAESDADTSPKDITRKILKGPTQHIPKTNQWLHTFYWYMPDQKNPTQANRNLLKFNKLCTIPNQMYFNVENVRTADDALVTAKLMIFYHLTNIDLMIESTVDPVAEFINGLTSDVVDFASERNFVDFKRESEQLSKLEQYPQFLRRIRSVGYEITKIVYRGYEATKKLQEMHNNAIEKRTSLRLENETKQQEQDMEDLRIEREQVRIQTQLKMEEEKLVHSSKMKNMQTLEYLKGQQLTHEQKLVHDKEDQDLKNQSIIEGNKARLDFLKALAGKELNVNITEYLIAHDQKIQKMIKVCGGAEDVHLHEKS